MDNGDTLAGTLHIRVRQGRDRSRQARAWPSPRRAGREPPNYDRRFSLDRHAPRAIIQAPQIFRERPMKFFVDTADVTEIKELAATGLLDGVTTNPSLVAKAR